jgi:hypothetical protein
MSEPIVVQATSVGDARSKAKDFAKVPRVGRGGEHISPAEVHVSSRGPNWQAGLEAQQQHGRPQEVGRRMAPAQSGPTAPNEYIFHPDGHGPSSGAKAAHAQSHFHATNARGEKATFLTGQPAQPTYGSAAATTGKAVAKVLPAIGLALVASDVAAAEPERRAQIASAGAGSLAVSAMAGAAAVSLGAPVLAAAAVSVAAGWVGSQLGARVFTPVPYQRAVIRLQPPPPVPPGIGWRQLGSNYYRDGPGGTVECWTSNGFSGYTTSCKRVGGVKLDLGDVSQFMETEFDSPGDPVSVAPDGASLTYRGVEYRCPNVTSAELATVVHLVFRVRARDIAVSLDPDKERNCMLKVFSPVELGQTALGRTVMEADVVLKQLVRDKYEPVHLAVLAALAMQKPDEHFVAHQHVYFTCSKVEARVRKDVGVVEFTDNDIVLVAKSKTHDPVPAELEAFVQEINETMPDVLAKYPAIAATRRYMGLVMMCKLLFQASKGTFTQELDRFVDQNLPVAQDPYEYEYDYTVPMHETTRQIGSKIIGVRGGVELLSRAMNLARPWRMSNPKQDPLACHACGYTIEPHMEKALIAKMSVVCQDCREEAKVDLLRLRYAGPAEEADATTVRLGNALKYKSAIFDDIYVADLADADKAQIIVPRLTMLGLVSAEVALLPPDNLGMQKYTLCSCTIPEAEGLDACSRCGWNMQLLREMSASAQGMICFVCRHELGFALYRLKCTRLTASKAETGPVQAFLDDFLGRFALSVDAKTRERDLQTLLTTFLGEVLDRRVRAKCGFVFTEGESAVTCLIDLLA